MDSSTTYAMGLRTGNWGRASIMLPHHASVQVQLAPADADGVLVRLVKGLTAVPRDLGFAEVTSLSIADASGAPRLVLTTASGKVERHDGAVPQGAWELRLQGFEQRSLHLYAHPGTPFPSTAELDALAALAPAAR